MSSLLAIAAVVLALIVAAGGAPGPPVQRLRATVTASEVTLDWQAPSGVDPDGYRVYRDGDAIATPSEPRFADTSVGPGTRYRYEVTAIVDGGESEPAAATIRTGVPPVAAALLDGSYRVRLVVIAAEGWESIHRGTREAETWRFSRRGTRLAGESLGGSWTLTLRRVGDSYRGQGAAALSTCFLASVTDSITVDLRVTAGRAIGGRWVATRFAGTYRDVSPSSSSGLYTCSGSSYTARIEGARI